MNRALQSACPYCGEPAEVEVDESGGSVQRFVQDCFVCCQPWEVELVELQDGEWMVTLRTVDE
jgi:hypothetical protein